MNSIIDTRGPNMLSQPQDLLQPTPVTPVDDTSLLSSQPPFQYPQPSDFHQQLLRRQQEHDQRRHMYETYLDDIDSSMDVSMDEL